MTRTLLSLCLGFLLLLPLGGCVRVNKTSEADDLKSRVTRLEQRTADLENSVKVSERMAQLESRLNDVLRGAPPAGAQATPAVPSGGEASAASSVPTAAPTGGRAHPDRYGGSYRQGIGTDPPNLDPAHISDTTSHQVGLNIFEGLVEFSDEDLSVIPCIAKSWEVSPDGTEFTFKLRDDVKFHNGRLCTAEDFVYSFVRMLEPKTASERAWLFEEVLGYKPFAALLAAKGQLKFVADGRMDKVEAPKIEEAIKRLEAIKADDLARAGVPDAKGTGATVAAAIQKLKEIEGAAKSGKEALAKVTVDAGVLAALDGVKLADFIKAGITAPDKSTLKIILGRPFAPFLTILAMPNAAVVPKEDAEKWGDQFSQHPVGTGPFKFAGWEHHVSVELEAFEDYFLGRPYLDKMRFRILPDAVARLYEFEIGNLESMNEIPDEKYEAIKANKEFPGVIDEMPTLSTYYMGFNVTKKPFDNPLVRKAFNHAVRKDIILNVIRRGRGTMAEGVLPPGMQAYNKELKGYSYDKEKALELLRQAGYDDPKKLGTLEYWYNATSPNDPNAKLAEVIQQNLREIGVETKLQSTDWGTYLKKLDRGELALFRLAWVCDYPDPDNFLYVLFHSMMKGEAGNHAFYGNPKVDELLDKGRTTVDPKERVKLYQEAEKLIVEDAPWIFLYHSKQTFLHKDYLKGATLTGLGPDAIRMRRAWIDRALMKKSN